MRLAVNEPKSFGGKYEWLIVSAGEFGWTGNLNVHARGEEKTIASAKRMAEATFRMEAFDPVKRVRCADYLFNPEVPKDWVGKVVLWARAQGLNLRAHRAIVPLAEIETVEEVDQDAVEALKRRIVKGRRGWPSDLPLVVVASNHGEGYYKEGYMLLDGHHRVAAVEQLGATMIPALVVSTRAYGEIADEFDVPRVDYINEVLAAVDPLIARNVKKGVGGTPKRRGRFSRFWDGIGFAIPPAEE
jgi:hypothetical protein